MAVREWRWEERNDLQGRKGAKAYDGSEGEVIEELFYMYIHRQ